ncbi:hypothetical protein PVA17_24250 [Lysinibacillus sp. CNPSo 3705]|uniref:hypothetical protein n=1 Tax=Lysinibacillus sp. CNPSo 3705 TaxID=3028148 RepID=UPI002363D185|nr:hypothetical protein [Lysinibacillus sp. CNPSo 3705]MDD1505830.1 hypothetical protein [Lysinibacillus sp. CNPSo 3705]
MLICKDELYTDRHSVGAFKVYLALEDAQNVNDIVKVIELVSDTAVFLTSKTVITFESNLESELLDVVIKYNSKL